MDLNEFPQVLRLKSEASPRIPSKLRGDLVKIMQNILRVASLSTLLFLANCSSSNSETVDEIVDESGDNQISSPDADEPASPEIPSPEQVSEESNASADMASVDSNSPTTTQELPPDQQGVAAISQAEDNQQSGLAASSPELVSPDVPPPPSLAEIVDTQAPLGAANETPDALSPADESQERQRPQPSTKSRKNKRRMAQGDSLPAPQLNGDDRIYIVQPGDTLGTISLTIYGTSRFWPSLAKQNQLDQNSRIYPGDALRYKADQGAESFESEWQNLPKSTVTVRASDTLSAIADRVMGSPHYWKLLWRWNEESLQSPHQISPGLNLKYVKPQDLTAFLTERKSRNMAH